MTVLNILQLDMKLGEIWDFRTSFISRHMIKVWRMLVDGVGEPSFSKTIKRDK